MSTNPRSPILAYGWLFAFTAGLVSAAAQEASANPTGAANPTTPADLSGPETPTARPLGPPAPAWVAAGSLREGDALLVTVAAGPYSSPEECRQALPEAIRAAAETYIDDYLGEPGAADRMNLPDTLLHELWVIDPQNGNRREHLESMSLSVGTMFTLHAQLRFDRRFGDVIQSHWRETIAADRLRIAGYFVIGGLALVGFFHAVARVFSSATA